MKKIILTLLASVLCAALGAQERGLGDPQALYISKGTFAGGVSGSYYRFDAKDVINLLAILSGTTGKVSYLDVDAHADWFFKDNLALVARFGYSNLGLDGDSVNLAGMLPLSNKHMRREKYEASIGVRKYMPLFNSKIFALFGEGRLSGSRGYSKSYAVTDRGKEGDYTNLYSVDLGLIAGLSVFVTENMAIQVSLPKLSVGMEWEKQTENQVKDSSLTGLSLSSRFNILGIHIGTILCF